jgi:hypothetical protein
MRNTYDQLIDLLGEREVEYFPSDEDQSIRTDLGGEVGVYRVVARVDTEAEVLQVLGYSPLRIPIGCRPDIAEAVVQANHGLRIGKFELNLGDGQLRFQSGQVLGDQAVGTEVIDQLISTTISMLDMYLPAFLSVVYGNELPRDAIRHVELACCNDQRE